MTESETGIPTYYVLPKPPWPGGPSGRKEIPDQAAYRTPSPSGPFEQWAFVILCTDLRKVLDGTRRLDTALLPLENSSKFADFLQSVREGRIGKRLPEIIMEEDRLSKVSDGTDYASAAQARPEATKGSALAVIIPDTDMRRTLVKTEETNTVPGLVALAAAPANAAHGNGRPIADKRTSRRQHAIIEHSMYRAAALKPWSKFSQASTTQRLNCRLNAQRVGLGLIVDMAD